MRRFRFKRHGLILIGGCLLAGTVWFFCFPVPIGWAVRMGLKRALPAEAPVSVALEGATFRWRWGNPSLRVDISGVAVRRGSEPLADVGALAIDVLKAGLREGRYAPVLVDIVQPRVVADLRTLPDAGAGAASKPGGTGASTVPTLSSGELAPLAALLPAAEQPAVIRANGFKLAVRNRAGSAEWEFPRIETRAIRAGNSVRMEFDAALAGPAPAPAVAVRASVGVESGRGSVTVRIPSFDTARLPSWPGAAAVPLRATVESEVTAELDLAKGKVLSVQGGLLVTDGTLTVPDLAAPVTLARVELKGKAAGDPLKVELETGRIEVAGSRVDLENVQAVLGLKPRATGKATVRNVRAAEWIALLPAKVRQQLPVAEDAVALLALETITAEGTADLIQRPAGGWEPEAVDLKGEIVAANAGQPLRIAWTAQQPKGGARQVRVDLAPFVPAEWGGRLFANSPAGALRMPLSATATAALDAGAVLQRARVEMRGGPGTFAAWGPLTRAVPVQGLVATAEIEEGGKLLRIPSMRLELDGPVVSFDKFSVTLPDNDEPVDMGGGVRLEKISADWAEAWLPKDALASLSPLGLKPADLLLDTLALELKARVRAVDGAPKLMEGQANLDIAMRVQEQPLALKAQAGFVPATQRFDVGFEVAKFEPSRLRLVLPEGAPPMTALDFPVSARVKTSAGLDGKLGDVEFSLNVGTGTLRAFPPLGVEVPLKEIALEGTATADFQTLTARTLNAEVGAGLKLRGREMTWRGGATPTVRGELAIEAVRVPDLLPLLPADLQKEVRAMLQAAGLRGARLEFAATEAPKEPGGWRIDRLVGTVGLEGIRAMPAAAGAVTVAQTEVEIDYPRATVRMTDATAVNFFTGAVSLTARVDAANRDALRAELLIEGTRARLLEKPWDQIALVGQPLSVAATLKGKDTAEFRVETADFLGRRLLLEGTAIQPEKGFAEAELRRLEFGRTALAASFQQKAADRYAVKLTGSRIDVEELLRTSTPFLAGLETPPVVPTTPSAANAVAVAVAPAPATVQPTVELGVELGAVEFGAGRTVTDLRVSGVLDRGWPTDVVVTGREGTANALRAELSGSGVTQIVKLDVDDASAWLATLAMPLREAKLPPGTLADSAAQLVKIPSLVAGGRVELSGELAARERFAGKLQLEKATIVRAPRVLQLLALKSGKSLAQQPLIERLAINRIAADPRGISLEGLTFAGTGLIDRLQVKTANYRLDNEKLGVDGVYFGVGFEVIGTRADPQVFLKDNSLLIRAVGQRNEFDFEAWEAEAKEKAQKK